MGMDAQALGEIQVGTAVAYLTLKDMGFFDEINKASSAMQGFQDSSVNQVSTLEKFSSVTSTLGSSLTRGITTPLVNLGKSSINTYKDMESAFTGVRKTIDESRFKEAFGDSVDGWEKLDSAIKEIAQSTNSTYEQVAAVMEWAGQLNVPLGKGGESIIKFTKTMVELGDSTNLTAAQSAESIAKFLNIVQGGSEAAYMDVDKLGSTIVDLGNNSATTEADIVSMAMRLAGAGKQIGLSETEILGFAAALSSVGITAEMGGSAFSKAMVKMQVAAETGYEPVIALQEQTGLSLREIELMSTNDSKSFIALADSLGMTTTELKKVIKAGNNLNDFANIANMSTEEFIKLYRQDATAALQAFISGLGDTESHGQTAIAMLDEMGFTEVRLRDVLLRLSGAQNIVAENIDRANKAWGDNSALSEEAEKRYATLEAQMNQLNERWKEMKYDIAELLLPVLNRLMDIAEKLINGWKNLSDGTKNVIVNFFELIAVIGPLLLAFGKISSTLLNIKKFIDLFKNLSLISKIGQIATTLGSIPGKIAGIATNIATVVKSVENIGLILKGIFGPAGIIAGIGIAVKNFIDMWTNGVNAVNAAFTILGTTLAGIGLALLGIISWPAVAIAALVGVILTVAAAIHEHWDEIVEWLREKWSNFVEWFKGIWESVVDFFKDYGERIKEIWNGFVEWWQGLGETIKDIWNTICDFLFGGIEKALSNIRKIINIWFYEHFGEGGLFTGIPGIIHTGLNLIVGIVQTAVNLVHDVLSGLFNILVDLFTFNFDKLIEDVKKLISYIVSDLSDLSLDIYTFFSTVFDNVKEFIGNVIDIVTGFFGNILGNLKSFFENISNWVSEYFKNLGETLRIVFSALGDLLHGLFDTIVGIVKNMTESISGYISGFIETIEGIFIRIINVVSQIVDTINNFVSNVIETVGNMVEAFLETISSLFNKVVSFVSEVFENITSFLKGVFKNFLDWINEIPSPFLDLGKNIIKSLKEGLESAWDGVQAWFEDRFGWVFDLVDRIKGVVGGITDKVSGLLPGHANGLDYVPYDNYVARLHEGERVLTKQEARDYNNGYNGSGGDTFNFYNTKPDPYEYARQMKRVKKEIQFG